MSSHGGGLRLEQPGHVLDGQDVDSLCNKLIDKVEVVLQVVLGLLGVGNVSGVTDDGLDDTSSLLGGIDSELHVVDIVERVEYSEDVESVLDGLFAKVVDGIVRVRRVADSVGTSDESLEGNVGDQLSQCPQSLPRVLVQEPHRNVKGGTTPTFQGIGVG